ncbi:MAG: hypothetical protein IPK67_12525 [Planctomycetes bacterium]|nr:hypothetical protein [Planctomycetota bacterium]
MRWIGLLSVLSLPALLDPGAVGRVAAEEALALSPNAYFAPEHFALFYLWAPAVVLSACALLLLPGLLFAWALGAAADLGRWVLSGLALSLVLVSTVTSLAQSLAGRSLTRVEFSLLVLGLSALGAGLLLLRRARGRATPCCLDQAASRRLALSLFAAPWLLLAALLPKFYWEGFNGDGVHAFEATRLLLSRPLPFWDADAGPISFYPGVTSALFAFPGSWFLRLFGPIEAAARLPAVLYLIAVFAGVIALLSDRRAAGPRTESATPGLVEAGLIWLALGAYFLALAFSASYDPYSADIALPATQDTLLMACVLGFVLAWSRRERGWLLLFTALTYVSLPSGLVLVVFFAASTWLVTRPRPWTDVFRAAACLGACMVAGALLPKLLALLGMPLPGSEYAKESMVQRFLFLQFTDVKRILYVALPCGILPLFALFAWKRLDPVARALALSALAYFLLFYVQAYVSLHHFVPAMVLPLAAFWRADFLAPGPGRGKWVMATGAAGALALWLSLPAHWGVAVQAKEIGSAIRVDCPGYERSAPRCFLFADRLGSLFPRGIDPAVPGKKFGGSPYPWNYYARRADGTAREVNYVVQEATATPPEGLTRVSEEQGIAVFVRDLGLWERHQALQPPSPPGSPWLQVDRGLLFAGQKPREGRLFILNVRSALRRLGWGG